MDVLDGVYNGSKVHVSLYVATNAIRAGDVACVSDEDSEQSLGVVSLEVYHDVGEFGAIAAVQDDVEAARGETVGDVATDAVRCARY